MADPSTDRERRIAELEQEVARLRSELPGESPPVEGEAAGTELRLPSRSRAITIAVAIALGAALAILGITYALSTVIEPFSKRAAEAIAPWEGATAPKGQPQPIRVKRALSEPRAPGL